MPLFLKWRLTEFQGKTIRCCPDKGRAIEPKGEVNGATRENIPVADCPGHPYDRCGDDRDSGIAGVDRAVALWRIRLEPPGRGAGRARGTNGTHRHPRCDSHPASRADWHLRVYVNCWRVH